MDFETLLYSVDEAVATITLHRPERLNTIVPPMPEEFEAAVRRATVDEAVKVIVVRGAGRSFCAGYDFGHGFHHWDDLITTDGRWDPGKDFVFATAPVLSPTQQFMAMWRTPKPVIAQVHGWCLGGGSDGAVRRHRHRLRRRPHRHAPASQLAAMKLVVNQVYENQGLHSTQLLGPILDGLMRNTPDARRFIDLAGSEGVAAVLAERDGPWADYSHAPPGEQPDPSHVIKP